MHKIRSALCILFVVLCLVSGTSGLDCSRCLPGTCDLEDPVVIESQNGLLKIVLVANVREVCVGNTAVYAVVYNESYIPPLLKVNRGDRVEMTIVNELEGGEVTNTHFHGLSISPLGHGDDVLIHITPGEDHLYNFTVPITQHAGLQWYHSHAHGFAQGQVLSGLAGGLIVNGILDDFPAEIQSATQKVFLMKETPLVYNPTTSQNNVLKKVLNNNHTVITVNGRTNPIVRMKEGELQFWRFAGLSSDRYFNVTFSGFTLYTIAVDGNLRRSVIVNDHLEIEPGSRREAFVYGPPPGTYDVVAQYYVIEPSGHLGFYYSRVLATVISSGSVFNRIDFPMNGTGYASDKVDLREGPIARKRTIIFSQGNGAFLINGRAFDIHRTDVTVQFGDVEEWTIINHSPETHTFHIHQMPFQVASVDGFEQQFEGYRDSVNVPYADGDQAPREVVVLIPFTDPVIIGKFVFHCHIMFHEDRGMMATVRVLPKGVTEYVESTATSLSVWSSLVFLILVLCNKT